MIRGCTITSRRYSAHARLLAESFLASNPGAGFSILLVDGWRDPFAGNGSTELLEPADIGIEESELHHRATMYGAHGFAASMKPNLLAALLAREQGPVLFLDADGCVYDTLVGMGELAERHSLVLSPHILDPDPTWWPEDSPEEIILRSGVFNSGLVGVAPGAEPFLDWWAARTARRCVFDELSGRMLEQTWLTLAASLFPHHVLRDRGLNVAGWNLQRRDIEWNGARPAIDGGPLRHFHFSCSYDPERPEELTPIANARWWPTLQERPGVARLSREYAQRLLECGFRDARTQPALPDAMPSGAPIEPWMRSAYRAALIDAERSGGAEPPNPFMHGEADFVEWLQRRGAEGVEALAEGSPPAGAAPEPGAPAPSLEARELAWALSHTRELYARIGELEDIRDDAIGWAQREGAERRRAELMVCERDSELRACHAEIERGEKVMDDIWRSASWRLMKPLRRAKAAVKGRAEHSANPSSS